LPEQYIPEHFVGVPEHFFSIPEYFVGVPEYCDWLREPSAVNPFLEPYLPFYDSLRDKPEYIEMLIEIDPAEKSSKLY